MGDIRCDAGVGEEARGADHQPLDFGVDGDDRVGVVERVESQRARVAPDLVRLVPTGGASAQRIGDGGAAAVRASGGGGCDFRGCE